MQTKDIIRPLIVSVLILLIPFVAMQVSDEWKWTLFDFVFMGILIFCTGLAYRLVARKGGTRAYRAGALLGLISAFLLVWVNAAVGIIGDGPVNMMYVGVIFLGIAGALIARFRPKGMARTMSIMAIAQALIPVIALVIWQPDFSPGIVEVFGLNFFFVLLFAGSAMLFRRASLLQEKSI